jgi:fucose 4-O-acetylase-like acetyltransferase
MVFHSGEPLVGALWFLVALFVVNIMFLILSIINVKINKRYNLNIIPWVVLFAFIIGYYLDHEKYHWCDHFHLLVAFITLLVFYAGYILKRLDLNKYIHWFPAVISFFLLIYTCNKYGSVYLALVYRNLNNPLVFIVGSFTGIYVNLYLANIIQRYKYVANLFSDIGRRSLSIMALQFVAFKAVNLFYVLYKKEPLIYLAKFPVITSQHYWWIAYLTLGITIPMCLDFIYEKLRDRYTTNGKWQIRLKTIFSTH